MIYWEIQSFFNGEWTNDVSLLGEGLNQNDNLFGTEKDAQDTMKELQTLWSDAELRVCLA